MKKPPIRDERIIEAIEVCRPGRDDVSDPALADVLAELAANPELAKHYERLQQLDANLGSAFRSVPVPDGLDQRLLARLQQARDKNVPLHGEEEQIDTDAATAIRPKRLSRRRVLAAGGVVAAAAILVIAATVYIYNSQPYTEASVLEHSVAFFQGDESPNLGKLVGQSPPPEDFPFSRLVGRIPQIRWRSIGKFLGCAGVAYDLPLCDQATLYVVRKTVPGLATIPPLRPQKNTGGFSAATWQEGNLLYVLVLRGNNSLTTYQVLVDLPHGPLI